VLLLLRRKLKLSHVSMMYACASPSVSMARQEIVDVASQQNWRRHPSVIEFDEQEQEEKQAVDVGYDTRPHCHYHSCCSTHDHSP